jgi:hypothetical protein
MRVQKLMLWRVETKFPKPFCVAAKSFAHASDIIAHRTKDNPTQVQGVQQEGFVVVEVPE